MFFPKILAVPLVGCKYPRSVRIVVVLQAPLGPKKPNFSPFFTEKVRSSTPFILP